jgi:hypothetical protein
MISPECTFTQRPFRTTRSAGFRPVATSTSVVAISAQGFGLAAPFAGVFAMNMLLALAGLCQQRS